jgi:hypothetical protein
MGLEANGLSNMFLAASGASAAAGLANSYTQANAQRQQGAYLRQTAEENALMTELERKDVEAAGRRASALKGRETAQAVSAQRVAAISQGIDIGSQNVQNLTGETSAYGALEREAIDNDVWRRAFGLTAEATNTRRAGRNQRDAANFNARMTLASGGLQFGRDALSGAYGYQQFRKK